MGEHSHNSIEYTLDFFILDTLSQEPLQDFVIEQRMQRIHRMLELAAERSGKFSPGSSMTALHRLERAGWLTVEWQQAHSGPEKVYSLTSIGREQLEAQRKHRSSALSGFVEDRALDDSFRRFLNRDV